MTRLCNCSASLASSLELRRKRKQLTKASCKTCGGRPLVDGIGPVSASMLSTVDLELTNFINPDLNWTKVTKGCRSTTRRSRKPAFRSLNKGVELDDKSPQKVQDSSVFESEKLGVAVLGRRFAEKVVDIPIKKRKLLLRSLSPPPRTPSLNHKEFPSPQPQTPSIHPEESEQLIDNKFAWRCPNSNSNQKIWAFDGSIPVKYGDGVGGVGNRKISEVTNGELGYSDDFSGIALLAAAACSSSIDVDAADNVKEASLVEEFVTIDSSAAVISFKEAALGTGKVLLKDMVFEDNMDGSSIPDNAVAVSHDLLNNENGGAVKKLVPLKDKRLQWDLNTVMDAWEEPCDDPLVDYRRNDSACVLDNSLRSEKLNSGGCEIQREFLSTRPDIESKERTAMCRMVSSVVHGNQMLSDFKGTVLEISKSNREEDKLEVCFGPDRNCRDKKCVSMAAEGVLESSNNVFADAKASNPVISMDASLDNYSRRGSHHIESSSGLPDNRTSSREVISIFTCNKLDGGNSVSELDKVDHLHPSPNCEDFSTLRTSIGAGQPVVIGDVMGHDDKASAVDASVNYFPVHIEPKELMAKYGECKSYSNDPISCTGKLASEDPFSDCYGSDVSQDYRGHMVGVENLCDLQSGYDSPFEDGELRESVVYSREESEVEDGETECLDFEFDHGDVEDFDAADYAVSVNLEVGREGAQILGKGSSLVKKDDNEKIGMVVKRALDAESGKAVEQCIKGDALKEPSCSASLKINTSGGDPFQERREDMFRKGNNDGLDEKGLLVGGLGSRASRGKLSSRIDGSSPVDLIHRKDRTGNLGDSYSRAEREFGSYKSMGGERFSFQVRGRNEVDGHWVGSSGGYWNARDSYPHNYRGPEGHGYSRPGSVNASSAAKVDGLNCHDDRRSISYSSKGMYRPIIRRRSPADRDDSYGVHRGTPPVRGIERDRSRSRSGKYPQGIRRGPRVEYQESMPDAAAASYVRVPHYLTRRERCFSPNFSRGAHFSRPPRKSRSRSRSHSPLAWNLQSDKPVGTRQHSPDFRSEARMEGMRLPFQKPRFAADYEGSSMSPPRSHLNPKRNSRWFDDRNSMDDHFRDRSPVRMFRRSQRFDSGRLKSDDCFRSMVRRGRFSQMAGAGRGRKYEDSDDDTRKHDYRYERIDRARRYDAGGAVRRFRYDAEDCFEAHNSRNEDE